MTGIKTPSLALGLALSVLAVVPGCDQDGELIGPDGGVVMSEDGRLSLEIPAGALDKTISVSIEALEDGPSGAIRTYALEPASTQLSFPATIEYDWSTAGGANELTSDFDGANTSILIERETEWRPLADLRVDAALEYAVGSATYFGAVAVVPK